MNKLQAIILLLIFSGLAVSAGNLLAIQHVVIIGVDGMSPNGIENAETPNMDELMAGGAYSFEAKAVLPTKSSPNWASMITGVPPKNHTVQSNGWKVRHVRKKSFCGNAEGDHWPTIFRVIREANPSADIACFHDWGGFGRLVESGICTALSNTKGEDNTTATAINYIKTNKPLFTFIHLDHVDYAGHRYGYKNPPYYESVEKADRLIGEILEGLKKAGIYENTLVLVTSDHGGIGKGHGGNSPEEVQIPWIISGPGVKSAHRIDGQINIYDTAVTIAYALCLTPPDCWTGKVVTGAFLQQITEDNK